MRSPVITGWYHSPFGKFDHLDPEQMMAEAAIGANQCDAVAFGVPFLANPDLVARIRAGGPLNEADMNTFYTPGPKGYLDYPFLAGG